jgi:hypothetical protein
LAGETITCRRCGAQATAEREHDMTVVPAGWKRVVVLQAGEGARLTDDGLDGYDVHDAYWVCPAHPQSPQSASPISGM